MKRSITTALVVAVLAGLTAGCGSGGGQPSGGSQRASALTEEARSYARSVNLRTGDVPWLKTSSAYRERTTREERLWPAPASCYRGVPRTGEVDGILSERFARSFERFGKHGIVLLKGRTLEGVSSGVYLMKSAALAREDVSAAGTARARACLDHYETLESHLVLLEGEPLLDNASASALRFRVPGVAGYGLRVSATRARALGNGRRLPYALDIFGFAVGPVEVVLKAYGSPVPVSEARERTLLALLVKRAQALQH
jgi:hypothetical protein